ncbi:MAG: CDP-diacylglycerol--serine O-phosphatidyltransferase [Planctomycetota bacterium]
MRHRSPRPSRRVRRRALRTILVVPTLVTAGNLLAGFLALTYLMQASYATDPLAVRALWAKAAWMVFLGMFCDVLDGRIARLTHSTSAFGAQLDSLADIVTFGVVPALLSWSVVTAVDSVQPRLLTALTVVYVIGAALRLARYNVEAATAEEPHASHVTLIFRGLPTPAAAGVVASLVLLHQVYSVGRLDWLLLGVTPILGLLMISRFPYPHVVNRFLEGQRGLATVVFLVLALFLFVIYFMETITAIFLLYAFSGVVLHGLARLSGWPRWVIGEEQDEVGPSAAPPPDRDGIRSESPTRLGRS